MTERPRRYRCVNEFQVYLCDGDGAFIENEPPITVSVGEVYEASTPGLESDYYLNSIGCKWQWLDIDKETFEECFEEVCDE